MLGRPTSYTARGLTTPRPGVFSGRRPRSLLARAFARNAPLRHMDWMLLVAVLTPIGSSVNGAHAWISLPGGFQVEPSEFAKVALILMTAMIFSQTRPAATGGPGVRSLLIVLACAAPLIGLVVIEPALG